MDEANVHKAFRYFDVICALSFGTSPIAGSVGSTSPDAIVPLQDANILTAADNLFGFVTDLWPLVHRLSALPEAKHQVEVESRTSSNSSASMRAKFETTAATLELAFHQWTPKFPGNLSPAEIPSDDGRLQSILHNAEAYRQACLVHLFRAVHGHPSISVRVQTHTKQALQACLRVIIFAGPLAALLWPLFVAACEAQEEVDRNVARTVFKHLGQRQGMQNIVLAWDFAEDVWRRGDLQPNLHNAIVLG